MIKLNLLLESCDRLLFEHLIYKLSNITDFELILETTNDSETVRILAQPNFYKTVDEFRSDPEYNMILRNIRKFLDKIRREGSEHRGKLLSSSLIARGFYEFEVGNNPRLWYSYKKEDDVISFYLLGVFTHQTSGTDKGHTNSTVQKTFSNKLINIVDKSTDRWVPIDKDDPYLSVEPSSKDITIQKRPPVSKKKPEAKKNLYAITKVMSFKDVPVGGKIYSPSYRFNNNRHVFKKLNAISAKRLEDGGIFDIPPNERVTYCIEKWFTDGQIKTMPGRESSKYVRMHNEQQRIEDERAANGDGLQESYFRYLISQLDNLLID